MDRTVKILLSIAIAVLMPVVVYFAAVAIFPNSNTEKPKSMYCNLPSRNLSYDPYCDGYRYNNGGTTFKYDSSSAQERTLNRSALALMLGLLGLIGAWAAMGVKPLMVGLAGGSAFTIMIAASLLSYPEEASPSFMLATLLLLISFVVLTAGIRALERYWVPLNQASDIPADKLL